jgi:hypothetical protein
VLTSFGLPSEYKIVLHEEIFSLCYHGQGGFTQGEVYDLPVNLRKFYLKKLIDAKQKEADEYKKASSSSGGKSSIARPAIKK